MSFWPFSNPLATNSRLQRFLDAHPHPSTVSAEDLLLDRELSQAVVNELHMIKGNFNDSSGGFHFVTENIPGGSSLLPLAPPADEDKPDRDSPSKGMKLLEVVIQPQVLEGLIDYLVQSVLVFVEDKKKEEELLAKVILELPDKTQVVMGDQVIRGEEDEVDKVAEDALYGKLGEDDEDDVEISISHASDRPPPGPDDKVETSEVTGTQEIVAKELLPDFADDPLDKVAFEPEDVEEDENESETSEEAFLRKLQAALDILSMDLWIISNRIIETLAMIKLWDILKMDGITELLPTVTHVVHILDQLMEANLIEFLNFIRRQPDLVDTFVSKVDIPVIMDYFLRVIQTDKPDSPTGIIETLASQNLIPKLVDILKPDAATINATLMLACPPQDFFRLLSATDFIKALVSISSNTALAVTLETNIGPNQLTRELVLPPIIRKMVEEVMLFRPQCAPALWTNKLGFINCVGIIIEVIRKNNSDYDLNCGLYLLMMHQDGALGAGEISIKVMYQWLKDFEENPPGPRDPIFLGDMLEVLCEYMDEFSRIMEADAVPPPVNVDAGVLGYTRFKIAELVAELLHCSNMILLNLRKIREIIKIRDEVRRHQHTRLQDALSDLLPAAVGKILMEDNDVDMCSEWDDAAIALRIEAVDDQPDLDDEEPLISAENPFVCPERDQQMRQDPCVGDLFKILMLDLKIMDGIITKFSMFPWNNFFHNVVFDLVQQIFNGKLNSYNSFLIVGLFQPNGIDLVDRIVDLYDKHHDDEFRPGYMGHLILISEEVVKFTSLYKPDLISPMIIDAVTLEKWELFVDDVLMKTRETYNVVLGGDPDDHPLETDAEYALEEDKSNNVIILGDPLNHDDFINEDGDTIEDVDDQDISERVDPTAYETDPQSPEEEEDEEEDICKDHEQGSDEDHELRKVPKHAST